MIILKIESISSNPIDFFFTPDNIENMSFDSNEEMVAGELDKQRRKLNDISRILDRQHQLLRLIIQVRSIKSHRKLSF